jgi:hypothetical protein
MTGERLVAHEVARLQHRVAEAELLALAARTTRDHARDRAHLLELPGLAARLEVPLEVVRDVEVILDRVLTPAGHDDDRGEPEATASSITYWMIGLSTSGSISFGCALVAGRKRVPEPAAGNTALRNLAEGGHLIGSYHADPERPVAACYPARSCWT